MNAAITRRMLGGIALGGVLAICSAMGLQGAQAADAGERAPDFKLPSTMGGDIALSDYRGKKWVLLEFYGNDFSPT